MQTEIVTHAGGLAVALPAAMTADTGLASGAKVDVEWVAPKLVVRPVLPTLDDLLAKVTSENCQPEWDTGKPVGAELL